MQQHPEIARSYFGGWGRSSFWVSWMQVGRAEEEERNFKRGEEQGSEWWKEKWKVPPIQATAALNIYHAVDEGGVRRIGALPGKKAKEWREPERWSCVPKYSFCLCHFKKCRVFFSYRKNIKLKVNRVTVWILISVL